MGCSRRGRHYGMQRITLSTVRRGCKDSTGSAMLLAWGFTGPDFAEPEGLC